MVQPTGWINPQWEEFMPAARSCVEADTTSKGQPAMGGTDAWREASRSLQRLDQKSRMSRAAPVRIREGLGVKLPRATRRVVLARYQGERLKRVIEGLLEAWMGLEINRDQTRVVDLNQEGTSLDFLGYTFRSDRDQFGRSKRYLHWGPSRKALAKER